MHLADKSDARFSGRLSLAISVAFALIAAFLSLYRVSLLPPKLAPRALQIASASTTVLVDTPASLVARISASTDQLTSLSDRAALIGNLMASDPVRAFIAKDSGIPADQIQADAPITGDVPRVVIEPGSGANAADLLAAPSHYVLQIQADPITPILHIYAQAPNADAALRLASGSVQGLKDYLARLATTQGLGANQAVRVVELGDAHGGVINSHANLEIALLTLVTAFAVAGLAVRYASRVRVGWRLADPSARTPS